VTNEHPCGVGQRVQTLDRVVERGCTAARKIAATCPVVLGEQSVAGEQRVLDLVGHTGGCVAWRGDDVELERTGTDAFAVAEEMVELATVGGKRDGQVEDRLERRLDLADALADRDLCVERSTE
jgi:hypothetical protein